jgi:hypothetical protein
MFFTRSLIKKRKQSYLFKYFSMLCSPWPLKMIFQHPKAHCSPKKVYVTNRRRSLRIRVYVLLRLMLDFGVLDNSTNVAKFLKAVSPIVWRSSDPSSSSSSPLHVPLEPPSPVKKRPPPLATFSFDLGALWGFYDLPYGLEVPLNLDGQTVSTFFVPYLSSIVLYPPPVTVASPTAADLAHDPPPPPSPVTLEDFLDPSAQPLFCFVEEESPEMRPPLFNKVFSLASAFPSLLSLRSTSVDGMRSWFSVIWYPILCHAASSPFIRGSLMTYHSFAVVHLRHVLKPFTPPTPRQDDDDASLAAGLCGLMTYKTRPATWFALPPPSPALATPLPLMRAAAQLSRSGLVGVHLDFEHFVRMAPPSLEGALFGGGGGGGVEKKKKKGAKKGRKGGGAERRLGGG